MDNMDISIVGEPTIIPETCLFKVDRPVYPGGAAWFGSREAAELSPLARRIFEIAEVESVLIAEERITVTKSGADPWPVIGRQIGARIREHIRSNDPAVSGDYEARIPPSGTRKKSRSCWSGMSIPPWGRTAATSNWSMCGKTRSTSSWVADARGAPRPA